MPLSFLNPIALLGVAGAAIPLLIHLIQKKPALPRPFAAMEFILKSHKKAGRRYKIKQILLLILRMTAVALLALTISGPIWKSKEVPAFGEALPTHWVLILDDSFSLGFKDNFEKTKNVVFKILEEIKEKDKIDLILVSGRLRDAGLKEGASARAQIKDIIKNLDLAYSPGSIIQTLEESLKILTNTSPELNQKLILITDLTLPGWQGKVKETKTKSAGSVKLAGKPQPNARLDIIDVSDPEGQPNHAVKEVKVFFPTGGDKELAILEFKVVNFSNENVNNLPASLFIEGKEVEKGFLNLKGGSDTGKRFYYPLKKGKPYRGSIAIAPDKLKIDDMRYFTVYLLPPKKILIVNGDPGTSLYTNEIYYLERALNPGEEGDSPFRTQTVSPEGLSGRNLDEFSSVILANVGSIKDDALSELTRFVKEGGGLLISLGDKVIPADFNRVFHSLAPQKIDKPDEQKSESEGLFLKKTADSPAGLKELLESKTGNLSAARFSNYFKLLPDKSGNPKTLLAFSNNAPAFIESAFGKGKVILYTSSIDRDWNNLPIQTSYLPFIHQLANYLGKGSEESLAAREILVGEPYNFLWNDTNFKIDSAKIVTPDNQSSELVLMKEGKDTRVSFAKTERPGFYRLLLTISKIEGKSSPKEMEIPFVVNLDTRESDLRRLTEKEIEDLASPLRVNIISWQKTESSLIEAKNEEKGVGLWGFFLVLLAGTLLAESVVTNKQV